jgi:hypothetical protein
MKYAKYFPMIVLMVFGLLVFGLLKATPLPAEKTDAKIVVPNKVQLKAEPFDLKDVRLLAGPFREAMLRDQNYLLSLRNLGPFRVSGWVSDIAVPETPTVAHLYTFYVGARNGGVWKTTNNGTTFTGQYGHSGQGGRIGPRCHRPHRPKSAYRSVNSTQLTAGFSGTTYPSRSLAKVCRG